MENILKAVGRYELLTEEESYVFSQAIAGSKSVFLKKGQYLWAYGDLPDYEIYVCSGLLRQYVIDNDNEKILHFYKEEDFFSDCTGQPVANYVQAIEDCELLIIRNPDWGAIAEKYPVMGRIGQKMMEELVQAQRQHLCLLMIANPEERYRQFLQSNPDLISRVSVTHLAQYLGLSRETISRIRAKVFRSVIS